MFFCALSGDRYSTTTADNALRVNDLARRRRRVGRYFSSRSFGDHARSIRSHHRRDEIQHAQDFTFSVQEKPSTYSNVFPATFQLVENNNNCNKE